MRLTLEEIKSIASTYVASNKIAQFPFTASVEDVSKMVEKIALQFTLDSNFGDKLPELDGQMLPYGDAIEEWLEDLILPTDYEDTGSNTLAPARPTYRNPSYSYKLGRKKFKTTVDYYKYQVVFHNEAEYVDFVMNITKKLYDSEVIWRYAQKRELLGKYADACIEAMNPSKTFAVSTKYDTGEYVKKSGVVAVVMSDIPSTNSKTFDELISAGTLVVLDLVESIAIPTDTSTGEAFVKKLKEIVEVAKDENEGHTLNGNVNVGQDLNLYVVHGVMPSVEVDTQAGAFHLDKISIPANLKVIKDFGATGIENDVFAILMDSRGARLFEKYRAVRTQENADGDFINYVLHSDNIAHYSKNTFIRVFVDSSAQ